MSFLVAVIPSWFMPWPPHPPSAPSPPLNGAGAKALDGWARFENPEVEGLLPHGFVGEKVPKADEGELFHGL